MRKTRKVNRPAIRAALGLALMMASTSQIFGQSEQPKKPQSINFFKQHKAEYVQPDEPTLVEVGPARYLVIEGMGAPGGEVFQQGISALFSVGFALKAMYMKEEQVNFGIGVVEGLWWADDKYESFLVAPREEWQWRLLMRVPMSVTKEYLKRVVDEMTTRGVPEDKPVDKVKVETIEEGLCVQMLHRGPYAEEKPNIERMHVFLAESDLVFNGPHHEIYLTSPQMTKPENMKTILRQPVKKKED